MKIHEAAGKWGLRSSVVENLVRKDIKQFFAVQQEVIPLLLRQNSSPCIIPQDICVSAPTGSGKTLSYAIPIVNTLLAESVVRLRALVLLPSRELAYQVHSVFQDLTAGTTLTVFLTTGSKSFEEEQNLLTGYGRDAARHRQQFWALNPNGIADWMKPEPGDFGHSLIDILVSTPGRLLDHLQFTEGFTLQHVRFLILDEADRLLGNAYHGWVRSLVSNAESQFSMTQQLKKRRIDGRVEKLPMQRLLFSATLTDDPSALALLGILNPMFVHSNGQGFQKFSETNIDQSDDDDENYMVLSRSALGLDESFELPPQLIERKVVVESKDRVLALTTIMFMAFCWPKDEITTTGKVKEIKADDYAGICRSKGSICIIFVSSVDASHRLSILLKLINNQWRDQHFGHYREELAKSLNIPLNTSEYLFDGTVEEMSRLIKPIEREKIISDALQGKVSIIVSSDRMARGIDLPMLKLVVNYDVPKLSKTYVHRVGRTARAHREGMGITIVKKGQLGDFRKLREEIGYSMRDNRNNEKLSQDEKIKEFESCVKSCFLPRFVKDAVGPLYSAALAQLPSLIS